MNESILTKTKKVEVIVSRCIWLGEHNSWGIFGDRVFHETYTNIKEAKKVGREKIAAGMSVVVRPWYNEVEGGKTYFREWRSFNGKSFKECKWII